MLRETPKTNSSACCSVIVCTRNRAQSLARTLESFTALEISSDFQWEVIVVDNGSSDHTPAVVSSFAERLPLRAVLAKEPGLSNARNVGALQASGDYIVWTDDDVIVDRKWLAEYAKAFLSLPDCAVFGGKIIPQLETAESAPWFQPAMKDLGYLLAARDLGDQQSPLSQKNGKMPFGANFAVKSAVQRMFPYDPNRGVAPHRRRGGEETLALAQMLTAGHQGMWIPDAKVYHIIPPGRQTVEYIKYFYEGMGECWAYDHITASGQTFLRPPMQTYLKLFLSSMRCKLVSGVLPSKRIQFLSSYHFHYGAWKYLKTPPSLRQYE